MITISEDKLFEELGDMIKHASEFGNDHNDREDMLRVWNELDKDINANTNRNIKR